MSEGASAMKEDEEKEVEREMRKFSRQTGDCLDGIKVGRDEDRLMNFGPYHMKAYGEVLRMDPGYVKFLIKGNQRDNQKARFAHWVTAFIAETFFSEEEEQEDEVDKENQLVSEGRSSCRCRRQTSAERERAKEEDGEPETDSDGMPIRQKK